MQVQKQEQRGGGGRPPTKKRLNGARNSFPSLFLLGFLSRAAHHIMTNVAVRGYSTREKNRRRRTIKTLPPVRRRAAAAAARSFPFFYPFSLPLFLKPLFFPVWLFSLLTHVDTAGCERQLLPFFSPLPIWSRSLQGNEGALPPMA